LGTLGGTFSSGTSATWINNRSQIVGSASASTGESHGFVYLRGQMYDLNELLSPAAQGLTVTSPVAINDRGQILANSTFNGVTR
jgi:probable HAF family extracellular repeat protein